MKSMTNTTTIIEKWRKGATMTMYNDNGEKTERFLNTLYKSNVVTGSSVGHGLVNQLF